MNNMPLQITYTLGLVRSYVTLAILTKLSVALVRKLKIVSSAPPPPYSVKAYVNILGCSHSLFRYSF
jgi:hypothetical protein